MKTSGFSAYTEKDFAIVKIARKNKLWISLCIFLIQVNNSSIKLILKNYLSNKINNLKLDHLRSHPADGYLVYVDIRRKHLVYI